MSDAMTEFKMWANKEYEHYGDVSTALIEHAHTFSAEGHLDEFIEFMQRNSNNAFADYDDIVKGVSA